MLNLSELGVYLVASFLMEATPIEQDINQFYCMVEAITFEANNQRYSGKQGVANTILRRVERVPKWNSVCKAIYHKQQFSYKKDLPVDLSNPIEVESFKETLEIAHKAVNGTLPDNVYGADHYYNPDKIIKPRSWMDKKWHTVKIRDHQFARLIGDDGIWLDHKK